MLRWAETEFNSNRFSHASEILLEGLKKSRSSSALFRRTIEAYYNESAIQLLKRGGMQAGVRRLEAGLQIVPNSQVMKDNLRIARSRRDRSR